MNPSELLEQQLLGAMVYHEHVCVEAISSLTEEHFTLQKHRQLFSVIKSQFEQLGKCDVSAIHAECIRHLIPITGTDLVTLRGDAYYALNPTEFINGIKRQKLKKDLAILAEKIKKAAQNNGNSSTEDICAKLQEEIFRITLSDVSNHKTIFSTDHVNSALVYIQDRRESQGKIRGISSGMTEFDQVTDGFIPGTLALAYGSTGAGKSTLGLQWAINIAIKQNIPTLYLSLEMPLSQMEERLFSNISGVEAQKIRRGTTTEQEYKKVSAAATLIANKKYWVTDGSSMSIDHICSEIRKQILLNNVQIIFIDHLMQISQTNDKIKEYQWLNYIAERLRDLAIRLNVSIIGFSQLNREAVDEDIPSAKHVAGSYNMLQKAHLAVAIYSAKDANKNEHFFLNIIKNRSGKQPCVIPISFNKSIFRIEEKNYATI